MYIFGGRGAPPTSTLLGDFWVYQPDARYWNALSPVGATGVLPIARVSHTLTSVSALSSLFMFGGVTYVILSEI